MSILSNIRVCRGVPDCIPNIFRHDEGAIVVGRMSAHNTLINCIWLYLVVLMGLRGNAYVIQISMGSGVAQAPSRR